MKIIQKEFNIQTGEEIITERDETAEEKAVREAREKEIVEAAENAQAKAAARQVILDRLGLTEDEAKLLLG